MSKEAAHSWGPARPWPARGEAEVTQRILEAQR